MGAKYHKILKHAMQDVRTSVYRRRPAPSSNGADAKPASTSKIFIYPFAIKSLDVISLYFVTCYGRQPSHLSFFDF